MSDTDKKKDQKSDPTEDRDFKKVVKHFLTTPPKPKIVTDRKRSNKNEKSGP